MLEITQEEVDALENCINTREDEGFEDAEIARNALKKLKKTEMLFSPRDAIGSEYWKQRHFIDLRIYT